MADIQHSYVESNVDVLDPQKSLLRQPHETLRNEQVCSADPQRKYGYLCSRCPPRSSVSSEDDIDPSPCEPYPGFENEIQRQLKKADALTGYSKKTALRAFLPFEPSPRQRGMDRH